MNKEEIINKIIDTRQRLASIKNLFNGDDKISFASVKKIIETQDFVLESIHRELKQLTEATDKRSELMEFLTWYKNQSNVVRNSLDPSNTIDMYLSPINAAKLKDK